MAIPARSSRPDRPHPLVIKGEATENSAAENFSGLAMHAVDEIAAYRDLVEEGIDAQFGQPGYRNALAAQTCGLESGLWGSPLFCFRGWKTAARYPIEMATTERDRSRPSGNTCLRLNLDMASDRPQIYSYLVHEMIAFAVDLSNPAQLWLDGPPLRRRQISIAKDISQVANRANVAAGLHNCLHECRNVFFLHSLHVELS